MAISLLFLSCKTIMKIEDVNADSISTVSDTIVIEMHNSQNSLDWQGTYKGIIPCADCEGIETEITLNTDMTFSIKRKYIGKENNIEFQQKGVFVWDEVGKVISFKGLRDFYDQYKVGENTLTQLDMEGKVITGETANKYILKK
jgi:uncharacterized lipoprotein NlpE involved in copper resistance